jgi:membrane protein implicated in regulation of membrane protease activity
MIGQLAEVAAHAGRAGAGTGCELWEARCSDGADVGEAVRIVRIEGLTLVGRVPGPR